ncbi:MAG: P1 family peptidase [Clostridia bacterium]|nr:P1 family peptidase [Clostridia bacterium]
MERKRAREFGIRAGRMPTGPLNKITDVPGVLVGHATIRDGRHNTGVTVILPSEGNVFRDKLVAASFVHNGFGKTAGTVQIDELGTLETPIALTNTLNVGAVSDALVGYMTELCEKDGIPLRSVNPVVGECNDAGLNAIEDRAVTAEHVREAIRTACADFEEGGVGAGAGTRCYGLKGGIGSASRIVKLDGRDYTLGVLVQSNYGATADLLIGGVPAGEEIARRIREEKEDEGSIMVILACDIPLSARQLRRVVRRCSVGIARMGSYVGHGSGEVFLGFSTANVVRSGEEDIVSFSCIREDRIDALFRAAGEATEEAILNSMLCADPVTAPDGRRVRSLREFMPLEGTR